MVGEINFWTWGVLFFTYLIFDILYTKNVIAISKAKALLAANTSVMILALSLYGFGSCMENYWNALPVFFGAWLGSFLSVKVWKRKKPVA